MSKTKISALINIRNEASYLADCLKSLKWVDEIVVVDMESTDGGADLAREYTHQVYSHPPLSYVEPARNYGLEKVSGDWVLIIDPDERVKDTLATTLRSIADASEYDYVRIPRQNIIFNQWISHTRWWPDYNIRFFKKGSVEWQNEIHSVPVTYGKGFNLPIVEEQSLTHIHYRSLDEYLTRTMRYGQVQAQELIDSGYKFEHKDLLFKPFDEFLSRFFAGEGYRDGWHGFVLSVLQGFSTLYIYITIWQQADFKPQTHVSFTQNFFSTWTRLTHDLKYWFLSYQIQSEPNKIKRAILKLIRKFTS